MFIIGKMELKNERGNTPDRAPSANSAIQDHIYHKIKINDNEQLN